MFGSSIEVAVGVIVDSNQSILLSKRAVDVDQGGLWEFPGGKIERGERAQQALCRELYEELGIKVTESVTLLDVWYDYQTHDVLLRVFTVTSFDLQPVAREGQSWAWYCYDEIKQLPLPMANRAIVAALEGRCQNRSGPVVNSRLGNG